MSRFNWCLGLIVVISINSFAQPKKGGNGLFFERPYSLEKQEISNVNCVFKDSHHFMWFGTENGLYRFDGVNLRYFGHKTDDSSSLPNNTVLGIVEDNREQLWVALLSGIAKIDINTLLCTTYTGANKKLAFGNYTNRICIDDSGNKWVGNSLGVFEFNNKSKVFTNIWNNTIHADSLSKYITSIVNIDKHELVASSFHDIIFFNKDNHSFRRVPLFVHPPPQDSSITSIFLDSRHNLWIGTWGGGIYTYNLTNNRMVRIGGLQLEYALPHFYITSFYETVLSEERIIWVATSIGLIKCNVDKDGAIKSSVFITYDRNEEHSIIPGKILSLYYDKEGALWCTGENGVCRCFPFRNYFKPFVYIKGLVIDIQHLNIDHKNCYATYSWNSITGPGLIFADSSGTPVRNIVPHFKDKDDGENISGIEKDKYNRIWVSSMAGVSVLAENSKVIHQWNKNSKEENNLTYYRTCGITIHHDTVWVLCYHHGIDLFDMSFKKLCHYSNDDNCGLKDNFITSLYNDSKGNIWICGNDMLYKYLPASKKFKQYKLSGESGGCGPRDIVETKEGNLVIASVSGVVLFNPETEKYSYLISDMLEKEQRISSVAIDKNDEIWFITDKHLVHYVLKENRFILFGQEDGLDISKGMHELRTFNGTDFYICQDDQVTEFNSDKLDQPITPPFLIVNFKVNDKYLYDSERADFSYDKNKLQFEFIGVSYIKPNQNQYYYQLLDVDKQWSSTYKSSVSYANLSPGSYIFKVKAVNYAGMWSNEKDIHFIIAPPYWQTWWFRIVSLVSILTILFFIIRYIAQRNLKEKILQLEKETVIEKERNRIAQDMHDDLGSGLTQIAILSEVAKKQIKQPEKAFLQLESISDSSRILVDNLQDIIWMLNTRHDLLDSLALYIREYAVKYFEQSGIHVRFNYPSYIGTIKVREVQRRNLFMAIKESLNNIIKHANASKVDIAFKIEEKRITFSVMDNGKGFRMEETRKFANGIKNMQSRMDNAGGNCNVVSEPGKGTCITFSLLT
jgi:signal transduction histidine kinase/ligand-binding sensor domain-containing protein